MWFRHGDDGMTDRQRRKAADFEMGLGSVPPPEFFEELRRRHAESTDQLVRVIAQHHMVLVRGGVWPDIDGPVTCECGAMLSSVADADVHMARMIQRADVSPAPPAALPE